MKHLDKIFDLNFDRTWNGDSQEDKTGKNDHSPMHSYGR